MNLFKRLGFTLNEVMIVLAVLGIVAALSMPTLNANIQSRKWNSTSQDFVRELEESLKIMNLKKVLAGYTTTKEFVNKFSEYIKIVNICDNNELQNCFADKVYWGDEVEEVDITKLKTAKDFGQKDWKTEIVGLQFANGVTGLIAYNPACEQNHLNNTITGEDCIALLYDTSGISLPNRSLKDLRANKNVVKLGNSGCLFETPDGSCWSAPFFPEPVSKTECEQMRADGLLSVCCTYCDSYGGDLWAGAVKTCGGVDNLPTSAQAYSLIDYLYEGDYMNTQLAESLGFVLTDGSYSVQGAKEFWIYPNSADAYDVFFYRFFSTVPTISTHEHGRHEAGIHAICIVD